MISIRQSSAPVVAALVLVGSAWPVAAQSTLLFMHSQPGDYIGAGVTRAWTPLDGNFTATRNFDNGVSVHFNGGPDWWFLDFAAAQDALLAPGSYDGATRFPFQSPTTPGLSVSGTGRGCNTLTGRFDVFEVVYGPNDTILAFAANFEQHCEGASPALFGSIRFQASAIAPHQVTVTKTGAGSGTVTSLPAGIDCGTDCSEQFTNATIVALLPFPSQGNMFTGWSGDADCSDGVISRGLSAACQATFEPCSVSLSPPVAQGVSGGGAGTLSVMTGPSCEWSASSSASWLRLTGATSGTGGASVPYVYDPRGVFAQPRSATISVGGQVFTLTQSGIAPTFSVTPASVVASPGAGATTLQVTANAPDAIWTASSGTPWITVPPTGGVGAVAIDLTRNASLLPRDGSLTIAGIIVPVTQRGNGIPGEPVELGAAVQNGLARFEWLPPPADGDATSYQLEAGLTRGAATFVFDTPDGTPAFTVSGVPAGRFYLRVRGRNEHGVGPASEEYELIVTAAGMNRPGRPRNTAATLSLGRLSLTWDPPAPLGAIDTYVLEIGTATGTSNIAVLPLGIATSFSYDGVPPGYYFLRVRAANAAGPSDPSTEVLVVAGSVPSPPGPPNLQPAVVTGTTVNLSWVAPQTGRAPLQYRLQVGSGRGLTDIGEFTTAIATTTVGFSPVPPGRYYVRVRGVNAEGPGPVSNEIRIDVH